MEFNERDNIKCLNLIMFALSDEAGEFVKTKEYKDGNIVLSANAKQFSNEYNLKQFSDSIRTAFSISEMMKNSDKAPLKVRRNIFGELDFEINMPEL